MSMPADLPYLSLAEPNIAGREWEFVKACLDSGWVSSAGSFVDRFEQEFAAAIGAPHAVSAASGTAALHIALLLAGVGPGDEVILPALTFIAPANAVRYAGAWPVFVDVEPSYYQMDVQRVAAFLRDCCVRERSGLRNRRTGRQVRAVLPVDILGHPVDLDPLHALAAEYELVVVEDATESLGACYRGRRVGTVSPLTCFSFNGNKLMTTGSGGMLTTSDPELARRAKYLTTQAKDDPIEFVHGAVGYNYRLSNVQAAIGCAQLERLPEFVAAKRRIAATYADTLADVASVLCEAPWARSAFWLATVRLAGRGREARVRAMRRLEERRIQSRPLWQPLHHSPALRGAYAEPISVAAALQDESLSLPCSTHLTPEEQQRVIAAVREVVTLA